MSELPVSYYSSHVSRQYCITGLFLSWWMHHLFNHLSSVHRYMTLHYYFNFFLIFRVALYHIINPKITVKSYLVLTRQLQQPFWLLSFSFNVLKLCLLIILSIFSIHVVNYSIWFSHTHTHTHTQSSCYDSTEFPDSHSISNPIVYRS